ncbi:hypothetical protein [Streptomyces sp. NPDC050504]|uniref:hypothetical protein n=1 Tax=Streptomyces sp. NPDC050504 TaxID=3365618 RepID=UPI00379B4F66
MIRNVLGGLLALCGAAAAVLSPFRAWYDGRLGRTYRIEGLFGGDVGSRAGSLPGSLPGSLFLPFAFVALLTVVGLLLRRRWVVALAGVACVGFAVLWMVRVGMAEGSLVVSGDGSGLGAGVAGAVGGGVAVLLGAVVMAGRGRVDPSDEVSAPTGVPTLDGWR